MREKIKLSIPVIVEGRYDKIKLSSVIDANIITTDGFGIFNKKEKLSLIRRLSQNGVILLCDSDGAGSLIRGYLKSSLPPDKVYNLYIPQIEGKEKRKKAPSKEGTLGVEGMENELLYSLFEDFARKHPSNGEKTEVGGITKADLYAVGMTGAEGSGEKRNIFAKHFSLPVDMTPNAFLAALNMLISKEEFYLESRVIFYERK